MNGGRKRLYRPPRYSTPASEAHAQQRRDRASAFGLGFLAGALFIGVLTWLT